MPKSKVGYTDYYNIKEAIDNGTRVFWKTETSEVIRTESKNYNLNTKLSKEKILTIKLRKVVKNFSCSDFYSLK